MKKVIITVSTVSGMLMLMLAAFAAFAQEEMAARVSDTTHLSDQLVNIEPDVVQAESDVNSQTAAPDCTTNRCLYLPALETAPTFYDEQVVYQTSCSGPLLRTFFSGADTINLKKGVREFSIGGFAAGYSGSRYETYYVINGQERRDISTSGTITSDNFPFGTVPLVFTTPGNSSCDSEFTTGRSYQAHIIIDDTLIKVLTVNIVN